MFKRRSFIKIVCLQIKAIVYSFFHSLLRNTVIYGVKDLPSFTRGISLPSDHPVAIAIICIINACNRLKIPIQQ